MPTNGENGTEETQTNNGVWKSCINP